MYSLSVRCVRSLSLSPALFFLKAANALSAEEAVVSENPGISKESRLKSCKASSALFGISGGGMSKGAFAMDSPISAALPPCALSPPFSFAVCSELSSVPAVKAAKSVSKSKSFSASAMSADKEAAVFFSADSSEKSLLRSKPSEPFVLSEKSSSSCSVSFPALKSAVSFCPLAAFVSASAVFAVSSGAMSSGKASTGAVFSGTASVSVWAICKMSSALISLSSMSGISMDISCKTFGVLPSFCTEVMLAASFSPASGERGVV